MSIANAESTLATWAGTASGLTIVWEGQGSPRPEGRYISLEILDSDSSGDDWLDLDTTDLEDPIYNTRGPRQLSVRFTCMAGIDGAATGATSPRATIEALKQALHTPGALETFDAANMGIGLRSAINTIGGNLGRVTIEPRAQMTVIFHITAEISEAGNYVEFVEITDEGADPDNVFWVPEDPDP